MPDEEVNTSGLGDDMYVLKSGGRVRVRTIPSLTLERVKSSTPMPAIPVFVDDEGNKFDNPADPDYIRACQEVEERRTADVLAVMMALGVELVDDGGNIIDPPDDGWEDDLGYLGIDWRESPVTGARLPDSANEKMKRTARKTAYLMYHVLTDPEDLQGIIATINLGAAEADAEASFQGNASRSANRRVPAKRRK